MKINICVTLKVLLAVGMIAISQNAVSSDLMVYPAKGQSADRMSRDRFECHSWAVQQSGFDPSTSQPASSNRRNGNVASEGLRGGFRGAAGGAAIGAIAGNAGRGAAIGATAGALNRGFNQHDNNRNSTEFSNPIRDSYRRAQAACLEGRGYRVQ